MAVNFWSSMPLIIGSSGSEKTNSLFKLLSHQTDIN